MSGIGNSPLGTGPYGYGSAPAEPSKPGQIYADAKTGTIGSGRKIDQATRQYVYGDDGRIAGQDAVPQMVYLAYATVRGSSILATLGERYTQVETIGDGFTQTVTDLAIEAVQPLIDQKLLEVLGVGVDRIGSSGVSVAVRWRDLTTGREGTTKL